MSKQLNLKTGSIKPTHLVRCESNSVYYRGSM